jgi:AcrR family transcriptional regulator
MINGLSRVTTAARSRQAPHCRGFKIIDLIELSIESISGKLGLMAEATGLRDRKKLETWRAIHGAAVELFLERGYDAVSVDDIAAAANVSHSTFFNYFTTKEAAVFDPDPANAVMRKDLLAARPDGEPLWTSLRAVLLRYVAWCANEIVVMRRLLDACPALAHSRRDMADHLHDELLEWAEHRHADAFALESVLLVNIAVTTVLTAYDAWTPHDGIGRLVQLTQDCFDRLGAGLEPHDSGSRPSSRRRVARGQVPGSPAGS